MENIEEFENLRRINSLMQHYSSSTNTSVIFTALPSVSRDSMDAKSYVEKLDVLSADLPPTVMVYGSSPVMSSSII